ncbi:sodium/potassium/calcium exchanger 4 [Nilaparvata lugens]|uniref:sodium/potassium/calcium exchanger 4 n=1 Tax=Nilaparvata lugens TaxID=108931 RepID=UPI00193CEC13|nr:sodium/potassium/calcium exchanger 4 [Nilaparvata lugens]
MDLEPDLTSHYSNLNCTPPAIDDFPRDIFTEQQRREGAVAVHFIFSLYLFLALAIVCDKYFVPAVEKICKALNMSKDVAGATFMATATSAPELFVNVIGTFITEGDIGVGTIVGSAVFNILAVAACCGIGAGMVVPLHWWPLTRDCLAYGVTVTILICIIHDERIEWYEALILVALYTVYIAVMYWDKTIQKWTHKCLNLTPSHTDSPAISEAADVHMNPQTGNITIPSQQNGNVVKSPSTEVQVAEKVEKAEKPARPDNNVEKSSGAWSVLSFPYGRGWFRKVIWIIGLPISIFLNKHFSITGDTLKIPDSVMGITFLAAGTSVPEAVSSVIVAKQGHGSMGISNSLGSNTFDILLCLGLPWLIKASFLPTNPGHHFVGINSRGLEYSAISLLSTLLLLYTTFAINKFKLDKKVGYACLLMYLCFLILASLIELNVFFVVNLPTCGR